MQSHYLVSLLLYFLICGKLSAQSRPEAKTTDYLLINLGAHHHFGTYNYTSPYYFGVEYNRIANRESNSNWVGFFTSYQGHADIISGSGRQRERSKLSKTSIGYRRGWRLAGEKLPLYAFALLSADYVYSRTRPEPNIVTKGLMWPCTIDDSFLLLDFNTMNRSFGLSAGVEIATLIPIKNNYKLKLGLEINSASAYLVRTSQDNPQVQLDRQKSSAFSFGVLPETLILKLGIPVFISGG